MQIVVFSLGGEEYALPITDVQEIIRYVRPRPVSSNGTGVQGVISLRGRIIPVCDLGARMGIHIAECESHSIVVVETATGIAGIVVDQVDQVRTLTEDQLEPIPGASRDVVEAIAKVDDRLIVLLNAQALLADVAGVIAA
jgi:purine-binding chemotaxis protein CheW